MLHERRQFVLALSLVIALIEGSLVAQQASQVSGIVRDKLGKPQMGVAVELLGSSSASTALTDLEGHYQIKGVPPGIYQLRASASLYMPSLRRQLRLGSGSRSVVNLILSGPFDETSWMSTGRPGSANGPDDWKWTLRSSENRPMLRFAADDVERGREGTVHSGQSSSSLTFDSARGGFGRDGDQVTAVTMHHSAAERRTLGVRSSLGKSDGSTAEGPATLATMLETETGKDGKRRLEVRVRAFPQIRDAQGAGLMEVAFMSAEQLQMGDLAALEVGSETRILHASSSTTVSYPFLHLTSRPVAGWTTSYGFSTTPGLAHYDDLGTSIRAVPTAVANGTKLKVESGWHQQITAERSLGRTKIQLAYSHDAIHKAALSGVVSPRSIRATDQGKISAVSQESIAFDVSNQSFRMLAPGFGTNDCSLLLEAPLGDQLSILGGYLTGKGLESGRSSGVAEGASFLAAHSQSVLVAVRGRAVKTGTRVGVSYRWQPSKTIGVIAPYETAGTSPYLSVYVHQALPSTRGLPPVELTIDGDNLLREGYQRYAVAGQEAFLASALQELRAGLSFTF